MGKWRFLWAVTLLSCGSRMIAQSVAPQETARLVRHILVELEADPEIAVYQCNGTSCSMGGSIFLNHSRNKLGPVEFVAAHECGHEAAGHAFISAEGETPDESQAIEKEADLLGAKALHAIGLDRVVLERIADLRLFAEEFGCVADEKHPDLLENAAYLSDFLIDCGYTSEHIDNDCCLIMHRRKNELLKAGVA